MLFNSYIFIFVFLPITFIIYFYLNKLRLTEISKSFLVLSSLTFYSWWNPIYLPIILFSMILNYSIGLSLTKRKPKVSKKLLLTIGISINIIILGYFKYADFLIENTNAILETNFEKLKLALPLAISFFTFQQIAYLVDSFKNETKEYDFISYCVFVTFFPQLIAGPIVHHKEIMPQFVKSKNKVLNHKNVALGMIIFSIGLFKKVVIADTFSIWATNGFDNTITLSLIDAWVTSLSYSFQLYFDFSGYTDMAIGIALLFNIRLPVNFNSPYKSINIQDFWRRWHITLSRFLRDYIYIPLGGSKKGDIKTFSNLMTTFIIGGLWHGAGWTFIFWGALHGTALVVHRMWSKLGYKMNSILAWFITFNFINIAWVFFRAKEWDDALKVIKGMFGMSSIVLPNFLSQKLGFLTQYGVTFGGILSNLNGSISTLAYILGSFTIVTMMKNSNQILQDVKLTKKTLALNIIILIFAVSSISNNSEFLYFNF